MKYVYKFYEDFHDLYEPFIPEFIVSDSLRDAVHNFVNQHFSYMSKWSGTWVYEISGIKRHYKPHPDLIGFDFLVEITIDSYNKENEKEVQHFDFLVDRKTFEENILY